MQQGAINAIAFFEDWVAKGLPTLEAHAKSIGRTPERVRQRIYKAAWVLRHPARAAHPLHGLACQIYDTKGKGRIKTRLTSSSTCTW